MTIVTLRITRGVPGARQAPLVVRLPLADPVPLSMLLTRAMEEEPTLLARDYDCRQGICAACIVAVAGHNVRACTRLVYPGETLLVEPARGFPPVRDLLVDLG